MTQVFFLGCNFNQIPYLKEIKLLGYRVVGVDLNNDAPGKPLCDAFYNVGYNDFNDLIEIADKESFTSSDLVFTAGAQFAQLGAATVAEHCGIPFPDKEIIHKCLNKVTFYPLFQQHDVPIPETEIVHNLPELKKALFSFNSESRVYLKSDFSKNPNHVYSFKAGEPPFAEINWQKDRYLREAYILQQEFTGEHLRLNIFGERYNLFAFELNEKPNISCDQLEQFGVINTLKSFIKAVGLDGWMIKFDVIVNPDKGDYAVLDIGLDRPYRMLLAYEALNLNFFKHYVNQYLFGKLTYPEGVLDNERF